MAKPLDQVSFLLEVNGTTASPPASALCEYLAPRAAALWTVAHPLNREDPPEHAVEHWRGGAWSGRRALRRPSRPPLSFALDPFTPLRRPRVDVWLAFSNLSACHALLRRSRNRVGKVVYWAIDFVPDRFGAGTPLTRAYDAADRYAARNVDLRVELTEAARDGRDARLGDAGLAPSLVAPIGAWLARVEQAPADAWKRRRLIFVGHLVARQGLGEVIEALRLLPNVSLDITGRGPEEEALRQQVRQHGLGERVRFLGFLPSHVEVEQAVAASSLALACYAPDPDSFTRYADPAKLRTYTAAGVPVVMTDVPPNARELEREAGATLVPFEAAAIAAAIERLLSAPDDWQRRREAALGYATSFDWGRIITGVLERLGVDAEAPASPG